MNKLLLLFPLTVNYEKLINYMIVGYAFSIAISKAGTSFFSLLMILFWLLEGNFLQKYQILKKNKFVISLFLFILFSALSILWSTDKSVALSFINKYWHFIIIIIMITSLSREYIKHVFSAFLIAMFISEIMSYGIFFEFWHYKNSSPSDPTPFMDHISYSSYLAFTAILLLNRSFFEEHLKFKLMYITYFITVTTNLFLNGGRTGQVIFILSLFLVFFLNINNKFKALLVTLILSFSIIFLAYSVSPVFKSRANDLYKDISNMVINKDYSSSFSTRVALWTIGSHTFKDHFFLGSGIGNEMKEIAKYGDGYTLSNALENFADYHNSFVHYAVQLGFLGLILFSLIFYSLSRTIVKDNHYRNLNIIFIFMFFLQSLVSFTFHIMDFMTMFVLLTGLFGAMYKYEQLNQRQETLHA